MTVVISNPEDCTLKTLERVAIGGERLRFSRQALERIKRWNTEFINFTKNNPGRFIYGVTSGYGPQVKERLNPLDHQQRAEPFMGLSFADECWPESHVRAMIFSLAAMVIHGATALSARQAKAVAKALDNPLPKIPQAGITSPGEMMVWFYLHRIIPALSDNTVACSHGNGAVGSVAIAGLRALAARRRVELAEQVFAL